MAQSPSTKAEVQARVNAVYDMLLTGLTTTQLVRHCSEIWDLSEGQIQVYISKARDLQLIDSQVERPQWLMQTLSKLQNYERLASEKGNIATALRCIDMQARLLRFELN